MYRRTECIDDRLADRVTASITLHSQASLNHYLARYLVVQRLSPDTINIQSPRFLLESSSKARAGAGAGARGRANVRARMHLTQPLPCLHTHEMGPETTDHVSCQLAFSPLAYHNAANTSTSSSSAHANSRPDWHSRPATPRRAIPRLGA